MSSAPHGATRTNPRHPFTLVEETDPFSLAPDPSGPTPVIGSTIPTGKQCPHCGALVEWLVYNPFFRGTRRHNGWMLHEKTDACCADSMSPDRRRFEEHKKELERRQSLPGYLLPERLRERFGLPDRARKTFANFQITLNPAARPFLERMTGAAQAIQRAAQGKTPPPAEGLLLIGPPATGKTHLLTALANAAGSLGLPALALPAHRLPELLNPTTDDGTPEKDLRRYRRLALEQVSVLCLSDLLQPPLYPSDLRALADLLLHRAERRLPTFFSTTEPLMRVRARFPNHKELALAVTRQVELNSRPVAVPGCPAFTPQMEKRL